MQMDGPILHDSSTKILPIMHDHCEPAGLQSQWVINETSRKMIFLTDTLAQEAP